VTNYCSPMAPRKAKMAKPQTKSTQTNVSIQSLPQWVKDTLECPVCLKTITDAPVYECENRHPLCEECHDALKERKDPCPVCRGKLTYKRNLTVEKILDKVLTKISCKYEECNYQKADKERVEEHEGDCEHRLLPCHCCENSVPLSKTLDHLTGVHKAISVEGYKFDDIGGRWVKSSFWDAQQNQSLIFKTNVDGKTITFIQYFLMVESRYLLMWFTHTGSKLDTATFEYTFCVEDGKSESKGRNLMTFVGFCLPMDTPVESIKQRLSGVVVPRGFIIDNALCPENKLHYSIRFSKKPAAVQN